MAVLSVTVAAGLAFPHPVFADDLPPLPSGCSWDSVTVPSFKITCTDGVPEDETLSAVGMGRNNGFTSGVIDIIGTVEGAVITSDSDTDLKITGSGGPGGERGDDGYGYDARNGLVSRDSVSVT